MRANYLFEARPKGGPLCHMGYVYILQSLKDGRTYVGCTENVERRFIEHNAGRVLSTKRRIPFKILFTERFGTLIEAKRRERWWKSGVGRRKLRQYFDNNIESHNDAQ